MKLALEVIDADGAARSGTEAEDEACLVHEAPYAEGDSVAVSGPPGSFIWLSLDDAMPAALVYLKDTHYALAVPFGERRKTYSPRAFSGTRHRLLARAARPEEIAARRDLALNPFDDHGNTALFPHASANVETRGEAVFAARNAIDGERANEDHGFWPYTSWGINRDPQAALTLAFGRPVRIDAVALTLRADFPHDAWWEKAGIGFSDGSEETLDLEKTGARQSFALTPRIAESLVLHSLVKADDPSPFPALTRIEVFGVEA